MQFKNSSKQSSKQDSDKSKIKVSNPSDKLVKCLNNAYTSSPSNIFQLKFNFNFLIVLGNVLKV